MTQPTNYPRRIWVLIQAETIVEDGREVVDRNHENIIGATYDELVAEHLFAVLNESPNGILRSGITPLSTHALQALVRSDPRPH